MFCFRCGRKTPNQVGTENQPNPHAKTRLLSEVEFEPGESTVPELKSMGEKRLKTMPTPLFTKMAQKIGLKDWLKRLAQNEPVWLKISQSWLTVSQDWNSQNCATCWKIGILIDRILQNQGSRSIYREELSGWLSVSFSVEQVHPSPTS